MNDQLRSKLADVRSRISNAAERVGRNPSDIKLIAVSKTHPPEVVRTAIDAGAVLLGENKVQEAEGKIEELGRGAAEWHLIGHLQSNKARKAVRLFDVIQTVDSVDLAERLERICEAEDREALRVLVQVDIAGESTKSGVPEVNLSGLVEYLRSCRHLKLEGLMIIPPYFDDPEATRPYFERLSEIRDRILPGGELSMGMSHDFEVAIEEGATIVRVGTAIFGEREYGVGQ